MKSLSAVIITMNEERNIGRCLESIADLVHEIVIVDSGSTDATAEICRSYPKVRFLTQPWLGYGPTKNYANSLVTSDYILSLDADEALSPALRDCIEKLDSLTGAYQVKRLTNYCGQWIHHSGWYPDKKIRLFPAKGAKWSEDPVHEDLVLGPGVPCQELDGELLHYSYYNLAEHLERTSRYSQLGAERVAASGKSHLRLRSIINPALRFVRHYFLKLGFLDGYYGFVISLMSSLEVFLKYAKADQIRKTERK